jgi:stearoyl-CoA desaturase (delta-9 desaturase)
MLAFMNAQPNAVPAPQGAAREELSPWLMMVHIGLPLFAIGGAFVVPFRWWYPLVAVGLYFLRMLFLTAAYHRYFAHRSFKTSRAFQFVLAMLGTTCVQRGPLWWAGQHRAHHRFSDQEGDVHSPVRRSLFWGHMGWLLVRRTDGYDEARVKDLAAYPELRWAERHYLVAPVTLALGLLLLGGTGLLMWGFFISTALLWHGTYCINSLAHRIGKVRYATGDGSRNNWVLALLTLGEGWHNNHHHFMTSVRQGFYWWEVDVTWYVLRALSWTGLVWGLREVPRHVRESGRIDKGGLPAPAPSAEQQVIAAE